MDRLAALCLDMEQWIVGHVPTGSIMVDTLDAAVVVCIGATVDVPVFKPGNGATAHGVLMAAALQEQARAFFTGWWAEAQNLVPWLTSGPEATFNLAHWKTNGTNLWIRPHGITDGFTGRLGLSLRPGAVRPTMGEVLPFFATLGATQGLAHTTPDNGTFWARNSQDAAAIAARVGTALPLWSRS